MSKGDLRCIEGRLFRHDPQWDGPDLETDIGACPDCSGEGCGDDGEPVPKRGRSPEWARNIWRERDDTNPPRQDTCDGSVG